MLCHPYDTPTFKTEALRLVTNEGRLKHLLLLYKWLIKTHDSESRGQEEAVTTE